ncbi:MAG TPA: hypothetical protein VEN82_03975, partial [Actinomycetota bacterium]|nr:hypothetical protein [Actinomycetota bacterium]
MAQQGFRVTYATLSADSDELHRAFDEGLQKARSWLGETHPFHVNGEARHGEGYDEERSPADRDIVIGRFARATRPDTKDAIAAASAFAPEWGGMAWQDRNKVMSQV